MNKHPFLSDSWIDEHLSNLDGETCTSEHPYYGHKKCLADNWKEVLFTITLGIFVILIFT